MQKVIIVDMALSKGIVAEGETDGQIVDKYYLRVNGELYHSIMVLADTSEARCAVDLVVKANTAAESAKTYAVILSSRILGQYNINKRTN